MKSLARRIIAAGKVNPQRIVIEAQKIAMRTMPKLTRKFEFPDEAAAEETVAKYLAIGIGIALGLEKNEMNRVFIKMKTKRLEVKKEIMQ